MINKNSITDSSLGPHMVIDDVELDGDGSLCLRGRHIVEPHVKPDTTQHSFYWLIETWLKNNNIPYLIDRTKTPYSSLEGNKLGFRMWGKEVSDIEYFINNLE